MGGVVRIILGLVVVFHLGSGCLAGDGSRWALPDTAAVGRLLSDRTVTEPARVQRLWGMLCERERLWAASKRGEVLEVPQHWLKVGEYRYFIGFISQQVAAHPKALTLDVLDRALSRCPLVGEDRETVLRSAILVASGSVVEAHLSALVSFLEREPADMPEDLGALVLENLAGRVPHLAIPALVRHSESTWSIVQMEGARRLPIREAALARLAELRVPLTRVQIPDPDQGSQDVSTSRVDVAGLANLCAEWVRGSAIDLVRAGVRILCDVRAPEIARARAELLADKSLSAWVREKLGACGR